MHCSIGQNIKSFAGSDLQCPVSGVCHQDCDVIYGSIFTKFILRVIDLLRPTLVAVVTTIWEFYHKISYHSAYVTDMHKNLGPNREYLGSL